MDESIILLGQYCTGIILEIHHLNEPMRQLIMKRILKDLDEYFFLTHIHGNNWGGEFGLYNHNGEELVKEIEPIFNRLVVFDTHDYSFHGLPNPLNFPEGDSRKSIILYYYTKEARPSELIQFDKPHSALWKKKNFHDKRGEIFRDFK